MNEIPGIPVIKISISIRLIALFVFSVNLGYSQKIDLKFNQGHSAIDQVRMLEDGRIISASRVDGIRVWDKETGKELKALSDTSVHIQYHISNSGRYYASNVWNGDLLTVYELESQQEITRFVKTAYQENLHFLDGENLHIFDGKAHIFYSLDERKEIFRIRGSDDLHWNSDVAISDKYIYITSKSEGLVIFDRITGKRYTPISKDAAGNSFWKIKVVGDELLIKDNNVFSIYSTLDWEKKDEYSFEKEVTQTVFEYSGESQILLIGDLFGNLHKYDFKTKLDTIIQMDNKVYAIDIYGDIDELVACSTRRCNLLELSTFKLKQQFRGSQIRLSSTRFNSSNLIMTILNSNDSSASFYTLDLKSGQANSIDQMPLFNRYWSFGEFIETWDPHKDSVRLYDHRNKSLIKAFYAELGYDHVYSSSFDLVFNIDHSFIDDDRKTKATLLDLDNGTETVFEDRKFSEIKGVKFLEGNNKVLMQESFWIGSSRFYSIDLNDGKISKYGSPGLVYTDHKDLMVIYKKKESTLMISREDSVLMELHFDELGLSNLPKDPEEWLRNYLGNVEIVNNNYIKIFYSRGYGHQSSTGLYNILSGKLVYKIDHWNSEWNDLIVSPDEKYLVTVSDSKMRFWEFDNYDNLLFDLHFLEGGEWIAIDDKGLFDASTNAMRQAYFVIGGNEIIELEQLKERYFEPNLIQKKLGLADGNVRNIKGINELDLYPDLVLSHPKENNGKLRIDLINRGGGIGEIQILINGKEAIADARSSNVNPNADSLTVFYQIVGHPYIKPGTLNEIQVKVRNKDGYLSSRIKTMNYVTFSNEDGIEPSLFGVVVGASDYNGDALDLRYASKDATEFANALQITAEQYFDSENVSIHLLSTDLSNPNSRPTKQNIESVFQEISSVATPIDVLVLYVSGHGINYGGSDGDFYYLTLDASSGDLKDPVIRDNVSISSEEFTEYLKMVPALKQVMIIDACHSGQLAEDLMAARTDRPSSEIRAFERMKDRTGTYILAGSAADAVSYEASVYGQGLLTYSLLFGMKGAALREDKYVDVMGLFQFCADNVPKLAENIGGIQRPEVRVPYGGQSFDIGLATEETRNRIELPSPKPLFVRSSFQNDDTFNDDLRLSDEINTGLKEYSFTREGKVDLIYVDAVRYSEAYSLKGRYKKMQNGYSVDVRLFKGDNFIKKFDVTGEKQELPVLIIDLSREFLAEK